MLSSVGDITPKCRFRGELYSQSTLHVVYVGLLIYFHVHNCPVLFDCRYLTYSRSVNVYLVYLLFLKTVFKYFVVLFSSLSSCII